MLKGDASDRSYYRIFTAHESYVLCTDGRLAGASPRDYPFVIMQKLLSANSIDVPDILKIDSALGLILLEDLGDTLLEDYLKNSNEGDLVPLYEKIITAMIRIQKIKDNGSLPFTLAFDIEKLMFEFNFFIEHALEGYIGVNFHDKDKNMLRTELLGIAEILSAPDLFVLNHRDFHSRNIMIHNNRICYIDFQDARLGLPHYDLVSLIRDSYVQLETGTLNALKNFYYHESRNEGIHKMGRDEFDFFFNLMAFQRNIKAVGSFGYLVTVKQKKYFEGYIIPTLRYVVEYAGEDERIKKVWGMIRGYLPENLISELM